MIYILFAYMLFVIRLASRMTEAHSNLVTMGWNDIRGSDILGTPIVMTLLTTRHINALAAQENYIPITMGIPPIG